MSARRERGRLLLERPAPEDWLPGWSPSIPVRRCGCGAPILARSARYSRCSSGHVRFPPRPAPQPPPKATTEARSPSGFEKLRRNIRILDAEYVAMVRKGIRPSARSVELALEAVDALRAAYPHRAVSFPWIERQRAAVARRTA